MTEDETLQRLAQVGRDLDGVTQRRTMSLPFGNMYNNVYNLVIGQKGEEVLALITETFRRLSLSRRPLVYGMAIEIIEDCAMYLDLVWLRRWEKPSLADVAEAMYDRPGRAPLATRPRLRQVVGACARLARRIRRGLPRAGQRGSGPRGSALSGVRGASARKACEGLKRFFS